VQSREHCGREPGRVSRLLGRERGELLGFSLELHLGPLRRILGVGEPGGVQELLVRAVVVADEPELLLLPHPPQHDLHLPLALQSPKANILKTREQRPISPSFFFRGNILSNRLRAWVTTESLNDCVGDHMYLDMIPDVGDGERSVLPDDIEDCARDGLRLLRRRRQLDRRHLRLPLLRRPPRRRREHRRLAAA
jgi:hypothetical protein